MKTSYVNLKGLEDCMNWGTSEDEKVVIMTNRPVQVAPRRLKKGIREVFEEYPIHVETAVEFPVFQDQYQILLICPFKDELEDIQIGSLYLEKGSVDNMTNLGADYEQIQLRLKKPVKRQGALPLSSIDIVVVDYHDKDRPLSVRRDDYLSGWIWDTPIRRIIPTEAVVRGYKPTKQETNTSPSGLDEWVNMHRDSPRKDDEVNPIPPHPCYDECTGLAALIWYAFAGIRRLMK